jgi:hypothetical protein
MKIKTAVMTLAICLVTVSAFANREQFNKPSGELASAIATAATGLGYDLSSGEGRKNFGDYLKAQKDTLATSMGIDMSTDEGRKKMHEAIKSHVNTVAKEQGFDMSTQAGRDSLEKYLVSKGEYAYLRPERKPHGERQEHKERPANAEQNKNQKERPAQAAGSEQKPAPRQ